MAKLTKLLVANRGEIARRVIRTAQRMGLATVAVFSDPDANAPFVAEADEAVHLPGADPTDTYLRSDLLVTAAETTGADAVHPGYGFLAENATFARAVEAAGLVFVGPVSATIEAMGSKVTAKQLAARAGVPILPWGEVTAGLDDSDIEALADEVGLPLLVKATFGGGGRGMHIVRSRAELIEAVERARREAASAFGDGSVFFERLVEAPRHVEVQILGDQHGNLIHLFERECSIQRRHQKVIEEAPAPTLDGDLREAMCAAAVAAGKAIDYVNAGTIEFILDTDGHFFFLEANTRLQVEHPVTELVTGLDLVELQLLVAQGEPLPASALNATRSGHAIEARLYAEDVTEGFRPASGWLHRIRFPDGPGLRIDSGYDDASFVPTHYDAMLAKVIAWAPTRTEAAARLADALTRAELHGVTTNRDLLLGTLRHPEFLAGSTDTSFYERHDPATLAATSTASVRRFHAVAALLATRETTRAALPTPLGVPPGWRNVGGNEQPVTFEIDGDRVDVAYRAAPDGLLITVNGEAMPRVRLWAASTDGVDLEVAGVRRHYAVHQANSSVLVSSSLGVTALVEVERFPARKPGEAPGSLHASLPGTVTQILVETGESVEAGQALVTIEAMKMEHTIRSPHEGTVTNLAVTIGNQVDAGAVLLVVEPDEIVANRKGG